MQPRWPSTPRCVVILGRVEPLEALFASDRRTCAFVAMQVPDDESGHGRSTPEDRGLRHFHHQRETGREREHASGHRAVPHLSKTAVLGAGRKPSVHSALSSFGARDTNHWLGQRQKRCRASSHTQPTTWYSESRCGRSVAQSRRANADWSEAPSKAAPLSGERCARTARTRPLRGALHRTYSRVGHHHDQG